MDIKEKVLNYIKNHKLLHAGDSVICAVSGGADSVCMLDILYDIKDELDISLSVAHLNHCLRGEEADRDEKFVKELCRKYSLHCYTIKVDVNKLAKESKVSCEEAGRIARYNFFHELKEKLSATKIATAHNKNDNVETVLMRIMRGTDIKGLSGIPVCNRKNVIRPILGLSRDEIEEHIKCKGLDFVTDSTNLGDDYSRNKIRHNIIPLAEEQFNSNFINVMASNIELFTEANNYIEKSVNTIYDSIISKDDFVFSFSAPLLLQKDVYIAKRIIKKTVFELANRNISNDLCSLIYDALSNGGSVTVCENLNFYVKYDRAFFVKKQSIPDFSYTFDSPGIYKVPELGILVNISEGEGPVDFRDKYTLYIDKSKLTHGLILRNRKAGDRMLLPNCGSKKIKDILIDEKIPAFFRESFPVFEHNGEIIWLCGLRDNGKMRILNGKKYIKITLLKEKNDE